MENALREQAALVVCLQRRLDSVAPCESGNVALQSPQETSPSGIKKASISPLCDITSGVVPPVVPAIKRKARCPSSSGSECEPSGPNQLCPPVVEPHVCNPKERTVPIHIRDNTVWLELRKKFEAEDILLKLSNTSLGVCVFPERVSVHHWATRILEKEKITYNTHQLPVDKAVSESMVYSELSEMGLPVTAVYQMRRGHNIWPITLVGLMWPTVFLKLVRLQDCGFPLS